LLQHRYGVMSSSRRRIRILRGPRGTPRKSSAAVSTPRLQEVKSLTG